MAEDGVGEGGEVPIAQLYAGPGEGSLEAGACMSEILTSLIHTQLASGLWKDALHLGNTGRDSNIEE